MLSVKGIQGGLHASDWELFKVKPGWFLMIPAIAFAFNGHFNAPSVYHELDQRSPERWATVTSWTYGICALITVACGVSGYLMFGSELAQYSNVLTTPEFHGMAAVMIAYFA